MGYLQRVQAKTDDMLSIPIEDVYTGDPHYKKFVEQVTDLLHQFSRKFNMPKPKMLELFLKSVKKEL